MSEKCKNFDFSSIKVSKKMSLSNTKDILNCKILHNGELPKNLEKRWYIENNDLIPFITSVFWFTSFLNSKVKLKERLFCIKHSIDRYPRCQRCNNISTHFNPNFINGYYSKFCSRKCNREANNPISFLSQKQLKMRNKKISNTNKKARQNGLPEEWKHKLKVAACKLSVQNKKAQTCLERYGVRNPGVLGAYHSQSASEYIKKYLKLKSIHENRCYFYDKTLNKKEFFQNIFVPFLTKHRFFCYDLVVFKDKSSAREKTLDQIEIVLGYNGPWHYKLEELGKNANFPAVPYKNGNSYNFTRQEVFNMDQIKLTHIYQYTPQVYVYWENTKQIELFKPD